MANGLVSVKLTWVDMSAGASDETGQEIDIYTDSPSFVPNVPINYSEARHPWMRLPPIAAGEEEALIELRAPVTFVKFRVRQYNDDGLGLWASPQTFTVEQPSGVSIPPAPVSLGFIVTGDPVTPPPPPVDPPPPPPPTGGGGASSNYEFTAQYSGVQGQNQWSYLDANDTPLTYNSASGVWFGAQAYQGVWNGGIHPGTTVGTKLRWTAPANGTAIVSGSATLLASSGTNGVTLEIEHEGASIAGPTSMTTTTPVSINETVVVLAGEVIDFIVAPIFGNDYCSTALAPVVQFTTDGVTPALPTISSLVPATLTVGVGGSGSLVVTLTSTPSAIASVSLSSSDATKATVPATVSVPAGQNSASFAVAGVAIGGSTITASYNSSTKQSVISVTTPPSSAWLNAPIGGSVLVDNSCSVAPQSSQGFVDVYQSTLLQSDATAPLSPAGCWVHRLDALAPTGGGQIEYVAPAMYRELYMGVWMRTNPQFQGRIVANKMFFLRSATLQSNGVLCFNNGQLQNGKGTLVFAVNGGAENKHIFGPSSDSGTFFFPNAGGAGQMTAGVWTKVEWRLRASTNLTSQDGVLQIWVNDVMSHNYQNINYSNGTGLNQWIMNQTWDGSGDMGVSNTVVWEYWIDHLHIVGKN